MLLELRCSTVRHQIMFELLSKNSSFFLFLVALAYWSYGYVQKQIKYRVC